MRQLLPFNVGSHDYALELGDIQEVVENLTVFSFPGAPEFIAGAIAFHGRIIPVVDLLQLFGSNRGELGNRLIVLTNEHGPFALGVDRVRPILTLEGEREQLPDDADDNDFVEKFVHSETAMVALVDLKQLRAKLELLCGYEGD